MAGDAADVNMIGVEDPRSAKRRPPMLSYETIKKIRAGETQTATSQPLPKAILYIVDAFAQKSAATICKINRLKSQKLKLEEHQQTNTFPRDIDSMIKCARKSENALSAMAAAKSDLLKSKIADLTKSIANETAYADSIEDALRQELKDLTNNDAILFPRVVSKINDDQEWNRSFIRASFQQSRENFLIDYLAKQRSDSIKDLKNAEKKDEKRQQLAERQQQQATQADLDALKKQIATLAISGKGKRGGAPAPKKENGGGSGKSKKHRANGKNKRGAARR